MTSQLEARADQRRRFITVMEVLHALIPEASADLIRDEFADLTAERDQYLETLRNVMRLYTNQSGPTYDKARSVLRAALKSQASGHGRS